MQPPAALKNTSCAADHSALTPFPQADIIYSINLFSRFGGIVTKYRYLIHPLKFAAALFTVVACTFLAILAATFRNWIMLLLFTVAAAVFVWVCVLYGSVLTLDAQGLVLRFCGFTLRTVNWSEVAEVGVVGLKGFNNNDPKHTAPAGQGQPFPSGAGMAAPGYAVPVLHQRAPQCRSVAVKRHGGDLQRRGRLFLTCPVADLYCPFLTGRRARRSVFVFGRLSSPHCQKTAV